MLDFIEFHVKWPSSIEIPVEQWSLLPCDQFDQFDQFDQLGYEHIWHVNSWKKLYFNEIAQLKVELKLHQQNKI